MDADRKRLTRSRPFTRWVRVPKRNASSACGCSGSHLGWRRGRHLAARTGNSQRGIDREAHTRIRRAGPVALPSPQLMVGTADNPPRRTKSYVALRRVDARLYGRRDTRRYVKRIRARGFHRKSARTVPSPGGIFNGLSDSLCHVYSVVIS